MRRWAWTGTALLALLGACQRSGGERSSSNAAAPVDTPTTAALAMPSVVTPVGDPVFGVSAMSIALPPEWHGDGTVLRSPCDDTPAPVFRANAPDGATGVQMFPRTTLLWSDMPNAQQIAEDKGCTFATAPASPADFVRDTFLPQARPGAEIVSVGPEPDDVIPRQVATTNAQLARQAATFDQAHGLDTPPPHMDGSAQRIRIRYASGGRTYEENLDTVLITRDLPQFNPMGEPRYFHVVTTSVTVIGARAPAGKLDAAQPLFVAMGKSIAQNPAWQQRLADEQQRQTQQQIAASQADADAAQRMHDQFMAQTIERARDSIDRIHAIGGASMAAAARSEAARHAGAQATVQHMGDRETVMDPSTGGTAEVSNQYNHSYYDRQAGRVLQTNDPGDPGANWTALQVVPPR